MIVPEDSSSKKSLLSLNLSERHLLKVKYAVIIKRPDLYLFRESEKRFRLRYGPTKFVNYDFI